MHQNRILQCAFSFGGTRSVALQTFGRRESDLAYSTTPSRRKNYAAAAFGAAIFFFDFGFSLFELEADLFRSPASGKRRRGVPSLK
jgi:hypothetical protein